MLDFFSLALSNVGFLTPIEASALEEGFLESSKVLRVIKEISTWDISSDIDDKGSIFSKTEAF
jgi:hypothetical protein